MAHRVLFVGGARGSICPPWPQFLSHSCASTVVLVNIVTPPKQLFYPSYMYTCRFSKWRPGMVGRQWLFCLVHCPTTWMLFVATYSLIARYTCTSVSSLEWVCKIPTFQHLHVCRCHLQGRKWRVTTHRDGSTIVESTHYAHNTQYPLINVS